MDRWGPLRPQLWYRETKQIHLEPGKYFYNKPHRRHIFTLLSTHTHTHTHNIVHNMRLYHMLFKSIPTRPIALRTACYFFLEGRQKKKNSGWFRWCLASSCAADRHLSAIGFLYGAVPPPSVLSTGRCRPPVCARWMGAGGHWDNNSEKGDVKELKMGIRFRILNVIKFCFFLHYMQGIFSVLSQMSLRRNKSPPIALSPCQI